MYIDCLLGPSSVGFSVVSLAVVVLGQAAPDLVFRDVSARALLDIAMTSRASFGAADAFLMQFL